MSSAFLLALASGAVMGLVISTLGAGGSLFIVPVLMIGFGQRISLATGTSLVIVFAAALVGALGHARKGHVKVRVMLAFGIASMAGAVVGSRLHTLAPERVIVVVLGLTLLAASVRMVFGHMPRSDGRTEGSILRMAPLGLAVGMLTGFVGVGGGFIIVPALVWGARIDLRDAIGTSLAIIAMSSVTSAATHIAQGHVDPSIALGAGLGAIAGAVAGAPLSGKLPERPLRLCFGALVMVAAIYILIR
jgi:uncharacterized membrane protein YfcA